ncbi:hypothetical protein [uncultured Thiodictyon sp.]|uniref:hypothetical protein n=1 Tax=uncultured Thiodictyon sp. TaxID=1846217 RepID=UPI0025E74FAD|nr:hypothetical protein [uncultured Thiodictyon sp.]
MAESFVCPRYPGDLRLSTSACASMWQEGRTALAWGRRFRCRGCALGAAHAGGAVALPAAPPERECLRCGAAARRLIRRQICLSCYNRERELLTGHYRRGQPPAGLFITRLQVLVAGMSAPVEVSVASPIEALRLVARRLPGRGLFAVSPVERPLWAAPCLPIPGS